MNVPEPENESRRLERLRDYDILDTMPEPEFDDIARVASMIVDVPIALVSLVDENRQWFKARVGLETRETGRDVAFCAHAILAPDELMVVPDARRDVRFAENPLVTGEPRIRFYAGAPLVAPGGDALGTLCVLDHQPRELDDDQREALRILARQAMTQLELRRVIRDMEQVADDRERYRSRLESYQRELEEANQRLERRTRTDELTGLMNRRAFEERLVEEIARAERHGTALSLLMIDADHFKAYNDDLGHPAGDEALKAIARALSDGARVSDAVARYGGEEFAAVLPSTDLQGAVTVAERCRKAVAAIGDLARPVTVSIGAASLACVEAEGVSPRALVAEADRALYEAKRAGRDRVERAAA